MELRRRKATVIAGSLVLLASLVTVWLTLRSPSPPTIDRTPILATDTGIGEVLAEETAKTVHDRGRVVLVTNCDHERGGCGKDNRWEAFRRELKKHGAISIIATEILAPDPNEGFPPRYSNAAFQTLLDRHAQTDAIIFFIDLRGWPEAESLIPQPMTAKIIAIDNLGRSAKNHYSGYFAKGILAALIFSNGARDTGVTSDPKTPREWFQKFYQVYTPENYESLPN